ncbi:hypothetical protein ZIOFF_017243 [Zingiber officinale]|uniref:Cyclin-like domain-containing protein n=1 Tax=Zingiber officinale TaxID=94328 RepID=A0A8J5H4I7_ZINOF|nr:hypothetical protein ZIOFF_017243 [Zingiber officinale]
MALVSLFDHLDCEEENLELEEEQRELLADLPLPAAEAEVEWEQFRCSLEAKEMEFLPKPCPDGGGGFYLRSARMETVEWVVHGAAQHGFSALTALLAVNYLDRCFLPCSARGELLRLQDDKPWMGRLAAVACLSLAAKVEETRVPLLLDLQLFPEPPEDGGFVFEPKTIRRMELLVLSALGWRTNPVTPLSFIHHLLPRLFSKAKTAEADFAGSDITYRVSALTSRCEAALLSVIAGRSEMGPISGIGMGGGGAARCHGSRRPPPTVPQRPKGGTFFILLLVLSDRSPYNLPPCKSSSTGKSGRMLSTYPGEDADRHDSPQAQALLRSLLLFIAAAESKRGDRVLLQLRLMGAAASLQEKQWRHEQVA